MNHEAPALAKHCLVESPQIEAANYMPITHNQMWTIALLARMEYLDPAGVQYMHQK